MQKAAFLMRLKPGHAAEYERRHDELWPELAAALTAAGINDYAIFLEPEQGLLFGVQQLADGHTAAELPKLPIMKRWWDYMAELMEVEPGNRPKEWGLVPMFHMA